MSIANSIFLSIAAFVFVLGVMIFVHELGHYLVAKFLGIRVEVFSLGFGRRLIGFRRGDTDYRISLLPLGGYVKMSGENYDEELSGDGDEFLSRPKIQRFAVAIAGPAMNLALAVILLTINFMFGVPVARYLNEPAMIGGVAPDSPAEEVGLQPRDTIVAIDGAATPTWQDVELGIGTSPNQELVLTIDRQGRSVDQKVMTSVAQHIEIGTIGVLPVTPYVIEEIEKESPAAQAGLRPGDEIINVTEGDRSALGFSASAQLISSSEGRALDFTVRRIGEVFEVTITPALMDERWRIGTMVAGPGFELEKYGFMGAVNKSIERNYRLTVLTFQVLGKIFSGRTSLRVMSGPIEIARFSGMAASMGVLQLLNFMALVSLNLGILNLMPIPILDGGVIALLVVETIMRRDLSIRVKERIFQVGFIFLMLLMGIVIFNDVAKNLPILD